MTDTTTMAGAQFQRTVGTDAEKWAAAFLAAYASAEGLRTDADRTAFVTRWLRDFADACVAEEVGASPLAWCRGSTRIDAQCCRRFLSRDSLR